MIEDTATRDAQDAYREALTNAWWKSETSAETELRNTVQDTLTGLLEDVRDRAFEAGKATAYREFEAMKNRIASFVRVELSGVKGVNGFLLANDIQSFDWLTAADTIQPKPAESSVLITNDLSERAPRVDSYEGEL